MLTPSDTAPPWTGQNQDGDEASSSDFRGTWHLLYFYPKDDTPGCTLEACGFRDHYTTLSSRISIIGVSGDSVESHKKFANKYSLPFTLVSDPKRQIIAAYGADGLLLPKRVTFLIDPTGTITKIYHGFDAKEHAKTIGDDLTALGL